MIHDFEKLAGKIERRMAGGDTLAEALAAELCKEPVNIPAGAACVMLPPPPFGLKPNDHPGHWSRRSKAAKQYRGWSKLATIDEMNRHKIKGGWRSAYVLIKIAQPRRAKRQDPDNVIASLKSAIDGLVDAGLLTNDDDITYLPVEFIPDNRPAVFMFVWERKE